MWTGTGDNGNGAVTVRERLSENVPREPLEIASVERSAVGGGFPRHVHQDALEVLKQFLLHRGVMNVRVTSGHLRPEMA